MSTGKIELSFKDVEKGGRPEVVMEFTGEDGIPFVTYAKDSGTGEYDKLSSAYNADGDDHVGDDPDDQRLLLALANAFAKIRL